MYLYLTLGHLWGKRGQSKPFLPQIPIRGARVSLTHATFYMRTIKIVQFEPMYVHEK
jgi:hypothetical protein